MKFLHKIIANITTKEDEGFTLIELLVVTSFIGVLSLIAYPSFLKQIGKGREAETQMIMGALMRAQQAYHWENQTFTNHIDLLGVGFQENYHTFTIDTTTATPADFETYVKHPIVAIDPDFSGARNFAVGVYADSGVFSISQCQSIDIGESVNVGNAASDACTNSGVKLF